MKKVIRFFEQMLYPLAVFTAALGLAYWYWTTTPSYALTAVVVSVKNRDVAMFEKFVNIDSITSHAFDDLLDGPVGGEILGRENSFIGMGFVRFFKRELIELAHSRVVSYLEEGNLKIAPNVPTSVNPLTALAVMNSGQILQAVDKNSDSNSSGAQGSPNVATDQKSDLSSYFTVSDGEEKNKKLKEMLKEYGISRQGYRGVKYLKIQGPKADLGIEFFSPKLNQNWVVDWQLEDAGGYWRVTRLANLNELVRKYLESRDKGLLEAS